MITKIDDCIYDNKYYWSNLNPNANVKHCLPNCTTLCYGAILQDGHLAPVKSIPNANLWHTVLTNGWAYTKYDEDKIEYGDILEWETKNHVAIVSKIDGNKKIVSASFYTGDDGTAYSTRANFSTLEQVSNFMLTNYPSRYFHCLDITQECQKVGGLPQYILKAPLYSVKRNTNKDQIEVLTFEQNVRDGKNNILKKAEKGFFNIISTKQYDGYTWYEVEKDRYIAGVNGRVVYLPKEDDETIIEENKRLKKENLELKERLEKIKELANYE